MIRQLASMSHRRLPTHKNNTSPHYRRIINLSSRIIIKSIMPKGHWKKEARKPKAVARGEKIADRVHVSSWRGKVTLEQAIAMGCRSDRTARRNGLMRKRSKSFVKKWFEHDPLTSENPYGTDQPKSSKYTEQHKQELITEFLTRNNDQSEKLSLREYCRQSDQPGCNKSNLSRWMRGANEPIRAYKYPVEPTMISPATETMRLQYCEANENRDWSLCAFSDEFWVDTNETTALLHGQQFYFTTEEKREDIPARPKSKVK